MKITRHLTYISHDPFAGLSWHTVDVEVCHADPAARVCLTDIQVPAHWSAEAAETFVHYYIRRAGVPAATTRVREKAMPEFLWRSEPDEAVLARLPHDQRTTHETSAKQVFLRLAGMWTYWGFACGYFDTEADARAFHDEIAAMLARQVMMPNSPQWFNTGLYWAYGMQGPAQGHVCSDRDTGALMPSTNAYERPQLHACFLHGVKDELVNDGGIMDLFEREMRAFKYGSGAGVNMSAIRSKGEEISSGGGALGLMRFLGIGDKVAGAIHSGGLPRRAGKMVVVDIDHPEVLSFIRSKGEEQTKIAALVTGARVMRKHLAGVLATVQNGQGDARFDSLQNPALATAIDRAHKAMIPTSAIERVLNYARTGHRELYLPVYGSDVESDVFFAVSAHQTRHAVRVTDAFMQAVENKTRFALHRRTDGAMSSQQSAEMLFDELAHAAWATGEPTVQFADTIAAAHTCAQTDTIRASTPSSEYLFVDDTACPLASINLLACADARGVLDVALFSHVVRIATIMLDISVTMAQYPSHAMARRTLAMRPIGLGFANFAPLLMRMGCAYESADAQAMAAAISGLLTGEACVVSADLAKELGAFHEFAENRTGMLDWIKSRRDLALKQPMATNTPLLEAVRRIWELAFIKAEAYGIRNAQLTCVPPTSTIAKVMECDTLGLMPLNRVVVTGPTKLLNAHALAGLNMLGYGAAEVAHMTRYVCGTPTLVDSPFINRASLQASGFGDGELAAVEEMLAMATDIHAAFDPFVIGERFCRERLNLADADLHDAQFSVLAHIGFTHAQIAAADRYLCGTRSLQGAPHMKLEDAPVFEQAAAASAQVALLAAAQPFLTGGIAHVMQLPHATTVAQCRALIMQAWKSGLKSISLKREHCALYEEAMAPQDGVLLHEQEQPTVVPLRVNR